MPAPELPLPSGSPVYSVYPVRTHSPLALGMVVACARAHDGAALQRTLAFSPAILHSPEDAARTVDGRPAVYLFSDYMWSAKSNLALSRLIKEREPRSITIHGGPHVPKYDYAAERFLEDHPHVDFAVRGEGELTTAELLGVLVGTSARSLSDVAGITYRQPGTNDVLRSPDRERVSDLDSLPSAYLSGWFQEEDARSWSSAILETNRGCPYGCTFCDWGSATQSKLRRFCLERIYEELEWIARHEIETLWIADANLGILPRDIEIAEMIASVRTQYGYPRRVIANHAKNATGRVADIVRILRSAGVAAEGIISIQTHDETTLRDVGRSNIKVERYEELITAFRAQGLPLHSDLMIGLPGATVESFKSDLQFFFDRQILTRTWPTVVLPNSPMAHRDYQKQFAIMTDERDEIVSTYSFSALDRARMTLIADAYLILVGHSVLKYWLYFLQLDHGRPAIEVIEDLAVAWQEEPRHWPSLRALAEPMHDGGPIAWKTKTYFWDEADWAELHREAARFAAEAYGIAPDTASASMLRAQAALMPRQNRTPIETVELEHDVVAYMRQVASVPNLGDSEAAPTRPLARFPPGRIEVSDPDDVCLAIERGNFSASHTIYWELSSALALADADVVAGGQGARPDEKLVLAEGISLRWTETGLAVFDALGRESPLMAEFVPLLDAFREPTDQRDGLSDFLERFAEGAEREALRAEVEQLMARLREAAILTSPAEVAGVAADPGAQRSRV